MTVSLLTQRVIFDTTDISIAVGDPKNGLYSAAYGTGKYMYIGASCPLNNLWVEFLTPASSTAGAPVIEVWYNAQWTPVVDIIDQTSGMTASGRIAWTIDIDNGWSIEVRSATVGLTGTSIYHRYWARISWQNTWSAKIDYIGQKFSSDCSLSNIYPDLMQPQVMNGFKSGKTNWDKQHFAAAELVIKELRKRNIIKFGHQLMDFSLFEDAATHKVAENIYYAFGSAFKDHALAASKRYKEEMDSKMYSADFDMDGHVTPSEVANRSGYMTR